MRLECEKESVSTGTKYSISWQDPAGEKYYADTRTVHFAEFEIHVDCAVGIPPGTAVNLEAVDTRQDWHCTVDSCQPDGPAFAIILTLEHEGSPAEPTGAVDLPSDEDRDYYDILQISPKADAETIHRVFRIMAARFHPDNTETGDLGRFLSLKLAYETLSDPESRKQYDTLQQGRDSEPMPIFELKDFVTGVESEKNRRLGVMSLLYNQRRRDPEHPVVSLLDLEQRMALPREYLTFTIWYLRAKDFVTVADNSDFCLTARGADYVETNAPQNHVLNQLLQTGSGRVTRAHPAPQARPILVARTLQLNAGTESTPN